MSKEITGKVNCALCRRFLGFTRADGSGPFIDECSAVDNVDHRLHCPSLKALEKYQPKAHALGVGNNTGPWDEDAMGYQSIARRFLEDGG